jgi:hypothetical protein
MMLVPHRKHTYGPLRPVMGDSVTTFNFYIQITHLMEHDGHIRLEYRTLLI